MAAGTVTLRTRTQSGATTKGSRLTHEELDDNFLFVQSGPGAVARTVQQELRITVYPEQKGAVGDGVTDDTTAFANALAILTAAGRGTLELDGTKTYLLNGGVASADGYKNGLLVPFLQINVDFNKSIIIEGHGAVLKAGSNDMFILRVSRNNVKVRNLTLDPNGKTGVICRGIVPEDMTQITTQVSQSYISFENVKGKISSGITDLRVQAGPQIGGSDSGCFYHNFYDDVTEGDGTGGRAVYFKKGSTWATDANRPTRTNFWGKRIVRGNTGYHFEVGSEIGLFGCNEEIIDDADAAFLATPTARQITNDCAAISFFGGRSENCTASVEGLTASGKVFSYGYNGSGSNVTFKSFVSSYDDTISPVVLTVTLTSSGGGAQGASSSAGIATKQGKLVTFQIEVNVAKGTLGAGTLSLSSVLPWTISATAPALGAIAVSQNGAIILTAGYDSIGGFISGSSITLRKSSTTGSAAAGLTLAECGDPVQLIMSGSYIAS